MTIGAAYFQHIEKFVWRGMTGYYLIEGIYVCTSYLWSMLHPRGEYYSEPPPIERIGEYVTLYCTPP